MNPDNDDYTGLTYEEATWKLIKEVQQLREELDNLKKDSPNEGVYWMD